MSSRKEKPSIVLMGSGEGTTIRFFCEAVKSGSLQAEVKALVTDNPSSGVVSIAEEHRLPVFILPFKESKPEQWDKELLRILKNLEPDFILLAGFLKKIGPLVLNHFKNQIINSHPALLPEFGGKGMYGLRVHKAVVESKRKETGVTIHVVNQDYDRGPVLVQEKIDVSPEDTPVTLQERVKAMEKRVYLETLRKIISGEIFMPRSFKELVLLFLKGSVLGLSTVLPGVSGGTAAFLLGLYEKLVYEISKIKPTHFLTFSFSKDHPFLKDYDWSFLLSLFLGAVVTVMVFPFVALPFIRVWPGGFEFLVFVLVLGSLYFPLRDIKKTSRVLFFVAGGTIFSFILFYTLKDVSFFRQTDSFFLLFLPAGLMAGLALVLPGLSGSYLLVLFGLYESVLEAVKSFQVLPLGLFTLGVAFGGIAMARIMKGLLKSHFHETSGLIVGLILGSLSLVWPF